MANEKGGREKKWGGSIPIAHQGGEKKLPYLVCRERKGKVKHVRKERKGKYVRRASTAVRAAEGKKEKRDSQTPRGV